MHAEDGDDAVAHVEVEHRLADRIGRCTGVGCEAARAEVAARHRHAARVGDADLAVVVGGPAGGDFLGGDQLDRRVATRDRYGRLVGVGGQVCDRGDHEVVEAGDADDGAGGDAGDRGRGAAQVAVAAQRECLE